MEAAPHAPRLPNRHAAAATILAERLDVPAFTADHELALLRLELEHLAQQPDNNILPVELFFKPAKNFNPDTRLAALEAKVENAQTRLDISEAALADTGSTDFLVVVVVLCHGKVFLIKAWQN
jgi:hypothetical protein